jgi:MerR family regulatory protein
MPKTYVINGRETELFTIGELAEQLDRQRQTIRKWEREGIIPAATFRSKAGRRLYTRPQITAIVDTVNNFELKQGMAIPNEFKVAVKEAFDKATLPTEN